MLLKLNDFRKKTQIAIEMLNADYLEDIIS